MAKARYTREQLEQMLAELDAEENTDEVWIKEGDREYKVTGKRAAGLLDKLIGPDGDDDADDDDDVPEEAPAPERTSEKYFGRKAS